jgi:hypothetical protein
MGAAFGCSGIRPATQTRNIISCWDEAAICDHAVSAFRCGYFWIAEVSLGTLLGVFVEFERSMIWERSWPGSAGPMPKASKPARCQIEDTVACC